MLVSNGFIMSGEADPISGLLTLRPFFPFVRSKDIIVSDPIEIGDVLNQMSDRWTVNDATGNVDSTVYSFSCKYDNLTGDSSGEPIGSSVLDSSVTYELFKDGRVKVSGVTSMNGSVTAFSDTKKKYTKTLYLPYGLKKSAEAWCSYLYGSVNGLTIGSKLSSIQNKNLDLNKLFEDRNHYYSKLDFTLIADTSENKELVAIKESCDSKYGGDGYPTYLERDIPIKFSIEGRWK